ncbi:MAG: hypothetical protein SOZ00_04795 [Tidjanibacter sp.]|nr:hypothetical protein [Tidjanibacter sp.]
MTKREILVLHSNFQTEEWFWEEYSRLIGALTVDCSAHLKIYRPDIAIGAPDALLIATGGTESLFKGLLDQLPEEVVLIADGRNNSLAAALEILTFLHSVGRSGRILHGTPAEIVAAFGQTASAVIAPTISADSLPDIAAPLAGERIGCFGQPSDWLIASSVSDDVLERYGVEKVFVPFEALAERIGSIDDCRAKELADTYLQGVGELVGVDRAAVVESMRIYAALKSFCLDEGLTAVTIRCFDVVERFAATSCLALSRLNDEGIVAACEGDMQSMMTMILIRRKLGKPSFMANPSGVGSSCRLAHCTVPQSMCSQVKLRTHFESGLGVALDGALLGSVYTLVKWGGERLDRCFVTEARRVESRWDEHLCRTQITLDKDLSSYLLYNPIGNHHIVVEGSESAAIERFLRSCHVELIKC